MPSLIDFGWGQAIDVMRGVFRYISQSQVANDSRTITAFWVTNAAATGKSHVNALALRHRKPALARFDGAIGQGKPGGPARLTLITPPGRMINPVKHR